MKPFYRADRSQFSTLTCRKKWPKDTQRDTMAFVLTDRNAVEFCNFSFHCLSDSRFIAALNMKLPVAISVVAPLSKIEDCLLTIECPVGGGEGEVQETVDSQ
jgi:hypothetical protein